MDAIVHLFVMFGRFKQHHIDKCYQKIWSTVLVERILFMFERVVLISYWMGAIEHPLDIEC